MSFAGLALDAHAAQPRSQPRTEANGSNANSSGRMRVAGPEEIA